MTRASVSRASWLFAVAVLLTAPACAQQSPPKTKETLASSPTAPASLETAAPPYEGQLQRLAELLGSLAYLRDLCGLGDGATVRARMAALLDAEATTGPRRDRIAGFFNRGFREYELMHRVCTPVSREAMRRIGDEAGHLARDIGHRYGGS